MPLRPGQASVSALLVALGSLLSSAALGQEAEIEESPYWARGSARPFFAVQAEVGAGERAVLQAGYGKPHWIWAGVSGWAFASRQFASVQGAVKVSALVADLELGLRHTWSLAHGTVAPAAAHAVQEFEDASPHASYDALIADLSGGAPTPIGVAFYELVWTSILSGDGPGQRDLLDEWEHAVTGAGKLATARAGLLVPLWSQAPLRLGPLADLVATFGHGTTARLGAVVAWQITGHLDLVGALVAPVHAPDTLGFTGTYGTLRLRFRWATGEPSPGL